jgi:hypothetical protein
VIGLLSDSRGDLDAFEAAYALLRAKGAERFFFLGGRYSDLDAWVTRRRQAARGGSEYTDADFLADVTSWLSTQSQVSRPGAFDKGSEEEDPVQLKGRFILTPERDSLQYLDPSVPRKLMEMVGHTLCCVVHHKNDLTKEDLLNAGLFLHGASPEPKVVQIGPRYFVTPGMLTGAPEQTCGLLETGGRVPAFTALRLDGKVVLERQPLGQETRPRLPKVKLTVK